MPVCLHCGQCCHLLGFDNVPLQVPCRYLKPLTTSPTQTSDTSIKPVKFMCSVYSRRLGIKLNSYSYCSMREHGPYDYFGCPFNTGDKPLYHITSTSVTLLWSPDSCSCSVEVP